ncbi:MAG: helix-turn-helix transcriptional regulator [Planctomycetota bacterium]
MGAFPQHRPEYQQLKDMLRALREDAELSQRALAELLDKPPSYVHKCETGERRIDPLEFIDWCIACGVKPAKTLNTIVPRAHR